MAHGRRRTFGLADEELHVVVVRREALRARGRDVGVAAHEAAQLRLERSAQLVRNVAEALRLVHLQRPPDWEVDIHTSFFFCKFQGPPAGRSTSVSGGGPTRCMWRRGRMRAQHALPRSLPRTRDTASVCHT